MLFTTSSPALPAGQNLPIDTLMEPNDSLEMQHQQPFLEEARDLEASIVHTETRTPRGGRSQPPIPDGINMRWLLKHDPNYTCRIDNLDYDNMINDKAFMASVWKHQHIRKLVETCPSKDAGVRKVRAWFKLLIESRTPSDPSSVERIFWNGLWLHDGTEKTFKSLLVTSGAAAESMAKLFARDADLATAICRARNSQQYRFCTAVYGKKRVLQLSLNDDDDDDRAIKPSKCCRVVYGILSCSFVEAFCSGLLFILVLFIVILAIKIMIVVMGEPPQSYCKFYEEFYRNSTNEESLLVTGD